MYDNNANIKMPCLLQRNSSHPSTFLEKTDYDGRIVCEASSTLYHVSVTFFCFFGLVAATSAAADGLEVCRRRT